MTLYTYMKKVDYHIVKKVLEPVLQEIEKCGIRKGQQAIVNIMDCLSGYGGKKKMQTL